MRGGRRPNQRSSVGDRLMVMSCAVAGCGSSSKPASSGATSGESTQYVQAVKFAHCMRAHRVPQFPDPQNPGGFSSAAIDALNTSSPAFISATNTCDRLLPNEGQPTTAEFEQAVVNGVKVARCMRAHGVNFPDPGIQGSHLTLNLTNVDTTTLKFQQVGALCDKKVFGYCVLNRKFVGASRRREAATECMGQDATVQADRPRLRNSGLEDDVHLVPNRQPSEDRRHSLHSPGVLRHTRRAR